MDNKGLHGGSLAAHREVPFFIFSTKFPENSGIRQMNQLEVAPLICNLLGIEASDKMQIGNTRGQQS
jgi:hypothetical protein